jgi:membrane protease YdiL (CAAX protease family)
MARPFFIYRRSSSGPSNVAAAFAPLLFPFPIVAPGFGLSHHPPFALAQKNGPRQHRAVYMAADISSSQNPSFVRTHPAITYFLLTFTISWTAAFLVAAPKLLQAAPLPKLTGILMFPAMLLGPGFTGTFLTRQLDGRKGLQNLFARMRHVRFPVRWCSALLIPPAMVLSVLFCLKTFVSPVYAPNRFWIGVSFGLLAGFLEEIGWMGLAYPKLRQSLAVLPAAAILGVFWGLWHAPVIDFLGAASPHGKALPAFFAAFVAAMAAMRVLIAWFYERTQSVVLAQLIHISSTGSLVVFSPSAVSPAQEATWYALYAAVLWLLVLLLVLISPVAKSQAIFDEPLSLSRAAALTICKQSVLSIQEDERDSHMATVSTVSACLASPPHLG